MKTRLLAIFVITIFSLLGYVQYADARCSTNEDWPDAPCYGCAGCYPGLEQEKIVWESYYDFKGKEFMESKLHQLQSAINDNMLQDWIDKSPIPQEHENVHYYYFLNGMVPDFQGMYFDQALEQESMDKLWEIVDLEFIDFSYTHNIGDPIKFILEKTAYSNCNSYDVKITDKDGNLVWGNGVKALCDPNQNPSLVASYIKIGYDEDHPIIINESGKYYIEIEIDNMSTKREFVVRQNHSGISLDRTVYPIPNPDPLDLWNSADVIIDGTVIEIEYTNSDNDNNIPNYHIKANKYFKGVHEIGLVFAQNDLHVSEFDVNDNGLFYLKMKDTSGYRVQAHSVKTFGDCDARNLIEISPVLPNEGFPRSAPTMSESYFDPCVADYFTYDPDFFRGILNEISPLKQTKHGIPNDLVRCYDDLFKIIKHDDSPACVKEQSIPRLMERNWIKDDTKQQCETFSGIWNEDFATCFDFSDDYDCEDMGGKLEGRAYTGEQPDYSKKSDNFLCEFRK